MSKRFMPGSMIRQSFIDYFIKRDHTFVPSSSLVPGGDQTLLFTNSGMVQFKEVFLGTDKRPYHRAVNSQKCMRVAGKHNDLEDVGRDNTHHTFFEMLGNWSFGDYYKKEAIEWAWDLLTRSFGLPTEDLWATCFRDEKGEIDSDDEAANYWLQQPGFNPDHVLFFGRKDNFWEMAEIGPCGPNSEIHIDFGPGKCALEGAPGHQCGINQDGCTRFLELWNLVFMQYNRLGPSELEPLPEKHVDTGMGFERITAVLQGVGSNYETDLLSPVMDKIQLLTRHSNEERQKNLTAYRVITDHSRAAVFLIADGVVPGNTGRNYVCRMIIRRAARFGSLIGLQEPFMAKVAETVIQEYGGFYQELLRHRTAILDNLTREEQRFQRTVEAGIAKLELQLSKSLEEGNKVLSGKTAFDLYGTYGLPLEITRDIARESGMEVDDEEFHAAMDEHRIASGAGEVFGVFGEEDTEIYRFILADLQEDGLLGPEGVCYDPYGSLSLETPILAIVRNGESVTKVQPGDLVEVVLPETCFYIESGGQVADTGRIVAGQSPDWEIKVTNMRKPAAGMIVHVGEVVRGTPEVGMKAYAEVDAERRKDIMRNHTATHLLHAELHRVLGAHARQAGSLVAPDRLRFDFTHPEALTRPQLAEIEAGVNARIFESNSLSIMLKPLSQAISEGAMALFGEKYGEIVRTITIGEEPFSYELCGGTHVAETGDIGIFLITSESSIGAGLRRIEAVTGRGAYELVSQRSQLLTQLGLLLETSPDLLVGKTQTLLTQIQEQRKQISTLRMELSMLEFYRRLESVQLVEGFPVMSAVIPNSDSDSLRQMTDRFRQRYPSGVIVLASVTDQRPTIIVAVTEDLTKRGLHAGEIAKQLAQPLGGSGGGRPTLGQAGGKDDSHLLETISSVPQIISERLHD